jgi:hypothetical protein
MYWSDWCICICILLGVRRIYWFLATRTYHSPPPSTLASAVTTINHSRGPQYLSGRPYFPAFLSLTTHCRLLGYLVTTLYLFHIDIYHISYTVILVDTTHIYTPIPFYSTLHHTHSTYIPFKRRNRGIQVDVFSLNPSPFELASFINQPITLYLSSNTRGITIITYPFNHSIQHFE